MNTVGKASKLTALMAQIDKGDYRVGIQYNHKVLCQGDNDNMDGRIRREHQKLAGTSNEIATEKFLEEAATLELYGVELYHVVDSHRVPKIIGVGPEHVQIYSASMELEKRFVCVCVCVSVLYFVKGGLDYSCSLYIDILFEVNLTVDKMIIDVIVCDTNNIEKPL